MSPLFLTRKYGFSRSTISVKVNIMCVFDEMQFFTILN